MCSGNVVLPQLQFLSENVLNWFLSLSVMIFIVWAVFYDNFSTVIKAVLQKLSQSAFF